MNRPLYDHQWPSHLKGPKVYARGIMLTLIVLVSVGCSEEAVVTTPNFSCQYVDPDTNVLNDPCLEQWRQRIRDLNDVVEPRDVADAGQNVAQMFEEWKNRLEDPEVRFTNSSIDDMLQKLEAYPGWMTSDEAVAALARLKTTQIADDLADIPFRRALMNILTSIR